jgi:hypothetical protein
MNNDQWNAVATAPDLSELADQLVAAARTNGVELTGSGGLLTGLDHATRAVTLPLEDRYEGRHRSLRLTVDARSGVVSINRSHKATRPRSSGDAGIIVGCG